MIEIGMLQVKGVALREGMAQENKHLGTESQPAPSE